MGRHEAEQIPQWASDDSESSCTNCPIVMSLGENDPYRHPDTNAVLCDSCYLDHIESALTAAREERDRAQDALRAIRLRVNRQFAVKTIDEYFALKPVSDRQPPSNEEIIARIVELNRELQALLLLSQSLSKPTTAKQGDPS